MKNLILCDDDQFEKVFPICVSMKLGLELQSFTNPNQAEQFPSWIRDQKSRIGSIQPLSMHGTFGDLNLGSYDPKIRAISLERMTSNMAVAFDLQVSHIIFHHGYVPHTSPEVNWIPRFVETLSGFLQQYPGEIEFHLENMLELKPDIMIQTLDAIPDTRVSACLDIGHAHCNSNTPVVKWIEKLGSRIKYVHLHDNDGSGDQHLALGDGTIPLKDVCAALNEFAPDSIWAIESHADFLKKSVVWLQRNGLSFS